METYCESWSVLAIVLRDSWYLHRHGRAVNLLQKLEREIGKLLLRWHIILAELGNCLIQVVTTLLPLLVDV
jgi:hypothetical protein